MIVAIKSTANAFSIIYGLYVVGPQMEHMWFKIRGEKAFRDRLIAG
jgi:hypothetical protein